MCVGTEMDNQGGTGKPASRERALAQREASVRAREQTTGEHEILVADREIMVQLREDALRARAEAEDVRVERDGLVEQLKRANEQLVISGIRSDEMADHARAGERAKDEFLAMLSHELRNPLSPILTAVEVMEIKNPQICASERATIKRHVRHVVRLVDDLLDLTRITGGKVELECEQVELFDVVSRAVEMARSLLEEKSHELVVHVPPGLVVDVDPARFAQVAMNLITNAAKYTPDHGRIVVSGRRYGGVIELDVTDNGIGISREMLPRVFEMFTQETQALDRARGGLGLGLAIVKTLVAQHGGSVFAFSAGRGQGSQFVVAMPTVATAVRTAVVPPVDSLGPDVVLLKILVVDDNEDIADLTGSALTIMGHDVRVAYDGPSALVAASTFTPDVAILDIGLPGMDGYDLAVRMRATLGDHVRLIAVSGYSHDEARQRSRDAGFSEHLVKPVGMASLRAALQAIAPSQI